MNGIKTEDLFIEASVDLDDGDNMPRNLARYARSSYSRKVLLKYWTHIIIVKFAGQDVYY